MSFCRRTLDSGGRSSGGLLKPDRRPLAVSVAAWLCFEDYGRADMNNPQMGPQP